MEGVSAIMGICTFSAGCFEACIKGLILLSKARCYRRDVSGISLIIELEMHKLHAWAVEVGLARQRPVLLIDTQYATVVPKVLKHLQMLLSDLDRLKSVYGLQLQEDSDHLLELDADDSAFDRLGVDKDEGYDHVLRRIFKGRKEPWKALKWVTFDEQKARGLLDQVRAFILQLEQILDRTRQAKLAKAIDMMLRNAVQNSANEQELDMIGSGGGAIAGNDIAAAAQFKKQGLLLGIMDVQQTTQTTNQGGTPPENEVRRPSLRQNSFPSIMPSYSNAVLAEMRLSASRLSFKGYDSRETRVLAHYDDEPVLLEFKSESGLDHDTLKDRLGKVSYFLRDLDNSFHGLSCRGFVKVYDRYAYVFDLLKEGPPSRARRQIPSFRTLRHLLDETSMPSLNQRLVFAITILETLLQLHTSGWLHKELRSDNILFIADSPREDNEFLLAPMRITGYVYARVDDLHEPTEPVESELQADLYRHPACLRQPREHYKRAFDAFSVGCILLELGMWCGLSTLFQKPAVRPQDAESRSLSLMKIRHEMFFSATGCQTSHVNGGRNGVKKVGIKHGVLQNLKAKTGEAYANVVMELMYASGCENGFETATESKAPRHRNLLQLEIDCLEKLRNIAKVL